MLVSLIAAMDENLIIGSGDGFIPWDLPRDKANFRSYTAGNWLLLGRTTFEEMDGWFTTQIPVVITRRPDYKARRFVHSITEAIALAHENGAAELVIGGGGKVFESAMPYANRLVVTRIDGSFDVENPVHFPDFESSRDWHLTFRERWPEDTSNSRGMTLQIWDKQVLAGR